MFFEKAEYLDSTYKSGSLSGKLPKMTIVWTQFVVQTDSALAQWAQDNKFVESELENWVLMDSSYYHYKFRDSFDEITEINRKISSIRGALFWYYLFIFRFFFF